MLIVVASSQVWAFSGDAHTRAWVRTTGLIGKNDVSKENLQNLWKEAQFLIDRYIDTAGNNVYQDLQGDFDWFSWGEAGHRLLFHWGFNNSPMDHPPLRDQVERCLIIRYIDDIDSGNKAEYDFTNRIEEIHDERRENLINEVRKITGFDRYAATALATIIYDIHMLCDYANKMIKPLPKINFLQDDIIKNGFEVLLMEAQLSPAILDQIEKEFGFPFDYDIEEKGIMNDHAKHIIKITGKYLTQILGENYFKSILEDQGLGVNPLNMASLTDFLDREFEKYMDEDESEDD
jgi:hypothetical protein